MTPALSLDVPLAPTNGAPASGTLRTTLAAAIGQDRFDRYFGADPDSIRVDAGHAAVRVGTPFIAETVRRRFGDALQKAARDLLGPDAIVRVEIDPGASDAACANERAVAATSARQQTSTRPASPTRAVGQGAAWRKLDDFIVGDSNRLAFEASSRIATADDASAFASLFLHGESGMGKTHLLQGIVTRFRERHPGARVRYTTGEQFTNAFIQALRAGKLDEFRRQFRALDLLCIDDVHFLSNKSATQSEFLHTFDAIDLSGARVVLASDEHPHKISRFNEKLVSRFVSGMVVRLERPDPRTRAEIVRRLLLRRGLIPAPGVCEGVADRCAGSVRELEGVVTRLVAIRELAPSHDDSGSTVHPSLVERALGGASRPSSASRRPLTTEQIVDTIAEHLCVSKAELLGAGRHRRVVLARSLAAHLARQLTTRSFPEIAKDLRRPNHSSVVTACSRLAKQLLADETVDAGERHGVLALSSLVERLTAAVHDAASRECRAA